MADYSLPRDAHGHDRFAEPGQAMGLQDLFLTPAEAVCCWFHVNNDDLAREEVFWKHFYATSNGMFGVRKLRRANGIVLVGLVCHTSSSLSTEETLVLSFPDWCRWHCSTVGGDYESFFKQAEDRLCNVDVESLVDDYLGGEGHERPKKRKR